MRQPGHVSWGLENGIGRIVLRRAANANALSVQMSRDLAAAIDAVLDAGPRAVLLAAEGRVFCAGGDIAEFVAAGRELSQLAERSLAVTETAIHRLATAPCAVVSAVNGPVGGAGIALALCADFVLGSQSMKLRTGYAAIGLTPDLGTSYFLARRIGTVRARQWLMLSDPVEARSCLEAGVIDALHPDDQLLTSANALVNRLAAMAPAAIAGIKRLCSELEAADLKRHMQLEHEFVIECARGADAHEGIRAFVEKRDPRFIGS